MNKNTIKGGLQDAAGKVQQKVGEATGNKAQQAKGISRQVEGKVEKVAGKIQDKVNKNS